MPAWCRPPPPPPIWWWWCCRPRAPRRRVAGPPEGATATRPEPITPPRHDASFEHDLNQQPFEHDLIQQPFEHDLIGPLQFQLENPEVDLPLPNKWRAQLVAALCKILDVELIDVEELPQPELPQPQVDVEDVEELPQPPFGPAAAVVLSWHTAVAPAAAESNSSVHGAPWRSRRPAPTSTALRRHRCTASKGRPPQLPLASKALGATPKAPGDRRFEGSWGEGSWGSTPKPPPKPPGPPPPPKPPGPKPPVPKPAGPQPPREALPTWLYGPKQPETPPPPHLLMSAASGSAGTRKRKRERGAFDF